MPAAMARVRCEVEIDATPDEVWVHIADVTRHIDWMHDAQAIRLLTEQTEGVGTRYVVSLYRLKDGELVALLDGQGITDLRTGACSGVIARRASMSRSDMGRTLL